MKNIFLLVAILVTFGAGCNKSQPTPVMQRQQAENGATPTSSADGLKDAPAIIPSSEPLEDDRNWSTATTRTGITLTFPAKGTNAPKWAYTLLDNSDPRLKGDCYVTDTTVYKRTDFSSFERACQTTTSFEAASGTRMDYFVFRTSYQDEEGNQITRTHLFTFTKTYPVGFNMNGYDLILEKIINIID